MKKNKEPAGGYVAVKDFVHWLLSRPEGTRIVQGREAESDNEIEYNDAIRRAAKAAAIARCGRKAPGPVGEPQPGE